MVTEVKKGKFEGNKFWLIFWIIVSFPIAIGYYLSKTNGKSWFHKHPILTTIGIYFIVFILFGIFGESSAFKSIDSNHIDRDYRDVNQIQEKISLNEALSLCYKKAEECTDKETNSEIEAQYYKSALRQSCLQMYSAYSLSATESIAMGDSEIKKFESEGVVDLLEFTKELC